MNRTALLEIGRELVITGGFARHGASTPRTCVIRKIGREYFYVADPPSSLERQWLRFRKTDWKWTGDTNWTYTLYADMNEYLLNKEYNAKSDQIERFFRHYRNGKLSLDTIRTIYDLLLAEHAIQENE